MFVFFSNRLGCAGWIVVSVVLSLLLIGVGVLTASTDAGFRGGG